MTKARLWEAVLSPQTVQLLN